MAVRSLEGPVLAWARQTGEPQTGTRWPGYAGIVSDSLLILRIFGFHLFRNELPKRKAPSPMGQHNIWARKSHRGQGGRFSFPWNSP